MPVPYSYDLWTKALEAIKRGERKSQVCWMLNINRSSLDLWLRREAQTGDYQAMTGFQTGNRHKITDWERFEEFAHQHGGKTQSQMAKLWSEGVTQQNISHALAKLGLSRQKKFTATSNEMRRNAKRLRSD